MAALELHYAPSAALDMNVLGRAATWTRRHGQSVEAALTMRRPQQRDQIEPTGAHLPFVNETGSRDDARSTTETQRLFRVGFSVSMRLDQGSMEVV